MPAFIRFTDFTELSNHNIIDMENVAIKSLNRRGGNDVQHEHWKRNNNKDITAV